MSERCPKCEADFYCGATDSDSHCDYWHCRSVRRIFNGGSSHFTQTDRCQVRCLTATLAACESELAEAQRRLDSIAKAQLNACTTECIGGIWWAKGSAIVSGPQATEQDALLEVAENWWRIKPDRTTHIPGKEGDDGEMH